MQSRRGYLKRKQFIVLVVENKLCIWGKCAILSVCRLTRKSRKEGCAFFMDHKIKLLPCNPDPTIFPVSVGHALG
jgi:hypothetical protein